MAIMTSHERIDTSPIAFQRRGENPAEALYLSTHARFEPGIASILSRIKPTEIVRLHRERKPDIPYPESDFFHKRTQRDGFKTTQSIQAHIVKGIPIDWGLIPSDTVRDILVMACEESQDTFTLTQPFPFLGGKKLKDLERFVQKQTGDDNRDIRHVLLADLGLLPPRGQFLVFIQKLLDEGGRLPTYPELNRRFGLSIKSAYDYVREAGLQEKLQLLRNESKEVRFPHSEEAAWVLGMLVGTSGNSDPTRNEIRFTNSDDRYKLPAFKDSAERIFGEMVPGITAKTGGVRGTKRPTVSFLCKPIVEALGDFRKREIADTIRERHGWVLDDRFVASFASGVFDSGGAITETPINRRIEFLTSHELLADLYVTMLLRLGITAKKVKTPQPEERVLSTSIKNIENIRKFAEKITSVNPEIQSQLERLKTLEKRKRRFTTRATAYDVVTEGIRLTRELGYLPRSQEIVELRAGGVDTFPVSAYIAVLGDNPDGGAKTWSQARKRLETFLTKSDDEIRAEVASIKKYRGGRKFSDAELVAEYKRIKNEELDGRKPRIRDFYTLYGDGRTHIYVNNYIRYMGGTYKKAIERLEELIRETDEIPIFP